MNDTPAAGLIVLLVYAVVFGVLIGRAIEKREREASDLKARIAMLEIAWELDADEADNETAKVGSDGP